MRNPTNHLSSRVCFAVAALMTACGQAAGSPLYTVTDLGTPGAGYEAGVDPATGFSAAPVFCANGQLTHSLLGQGQIQSGNYVLANYGGEAGVSLPNYPGTYTGGPLAYSGMANSTFAGQGALGAVFSGSLYPILGINQFRETEGFGINSSGEVVGVVFSGDDIGAGKPFASSPSTGLHLLPTPNNTSGVAFAINSQGDIVGESTILQYGGPTHAFLYNGTSSVDLNTLIPSSAGLTLINATGINDQGQITGQAVNAQGVVQEYLLTPTSLPTQTPEPTVLMMVVLVASGYGIRALAKRCSRG